jgi:hypothetical protein
VLLRDGATGAVYYLTYPNVSQVDLTDDYVAAALFGSGEWEDQMQRLQAREREPGAAPGDNGGLLVDVTLDQEAFRDLISVLADE